MPLVQHDCNFSLEYDAIVRPKPVVMKELTPLRLVLLGIWSIALARPTNEGSNLRQNIDDT